MSDDRLDGKVVLVTGSSSGIGEAVARRADALGASVVVNSVRSVEAGTSIAASLKHAIYVQGDVALEADCQRMVDETLERFGRLDVLVNNAGVTKLIEHKDLDAASVDVFREIFDVNVFGTWAMTMAAVPSLRLHHGAIINMTSVAGVRPTGSSIPYAASKAALNHLTVLLAKVVGPDIRVNAIAPGLVATPWTEDWGSLHALVAAVAPMKRSATPEDVAKATIDLATSDYITGQVLVVDGGLSIVT